MRTVRTSARTFASFMTRTATSLLIVCLGVFPPLAVRAQETHRARITVDLQTVQNPLNPLLYGQFLEFMYQGVKEGVQAELLRDRSFEESPNAIGLPRHWERYPDDRNDDYALSFHWDETVSYPGRRELKVDTGEKSPVEHSLRVDAGDGVIPRHGFYQPRIPLRGGLQYRGYLWLKTESYSGALTVALEADVDGGEVYASQDLTNISGDWHKYEFSLKPAKSDAHARFAVLFPGRGRLWVDQVSLMPADAAPGGVRREVFERIKALKPAFLRWPGGNVAQDYRWLWGVGPRDQRFTWVNLSWRNEPEPSDFGTDEYIQFARAVGAEPTITINVEGRAATAAEAAAWVEYCNGPPTSKYGALRAANGHPEPYNVKIWEIGNEIWGSWVRGHSDAATYARNYNRYVPAMRAVDPSLKFIAVGDNDMQWNRKVLEEAGKNIDYLAIHHYYGRREIAGDQLNLMARPLYYERFYHQVEQLLREVVPEKQIKLAINEWGLDLPVERQYSMEAGLYGARLMNVFERRGALVAMSAVSDLVNGWPGGIIQAGRHGVFVSPTFLVNQLYSEHKGSERLSMAVDSPTFDSSKEGRNVAYLDAVASRSADGKQIFIKLVNTDLGRALPTTIELAGPAVSVTGAELKTVSAPSLTVWNNFARPEAIAIKSDSVRAGKTFEVVLPKHSVTVMVIKIDR